MPTTSLVSSDLPLVAATSSIATILLCLSLVLGQLVRVPLPGQGGGLLLSDIAVVVIIVISTIMFFVMQIRGGAAGVPHQARNTMSTWWGCSQRQDPAHGLMSLCLITPFILWSALSLAVNLPSYSGSEGLIGLLYWVRLTTHLLLIPALLLIFSYPPAQNSLWNGLSFTALVLGSIGLIQWWYLPDLHSLAVWGWDPHQNRLVSTWLDPNFMGIFFVLIIPLLVARVFIVSKYKLINSIILFISLMSLALTQSRSSVIAVAAAVMLLSPVILIGYSLKHPQKVKIAGFILTISLFLLITFGIGFIMKERIKGVITFDPTVELRYNALLSAIPLLKENSGIGVGYNMYQFVAQKENLISDFSIHSRAGLDNSYLTLWVTTGIPGLFLFLFPISILISTLVYNWVRHFDAISLAAALSIVSLIIHANFINSLLYSHILIVLAVIIALSIRQITSLSPRL